MPPILNNHIWISLSNEMRYRLRVIFNIPRSSNTSVNDGVIETDGTTTEDFKHITIEKMQTYVSSTETDFHKLFDMTVAKINDELNPTVKEEIAQVIEAPKKIKNAKKIKNETTTKE